MPRQRLVAGKYFDQLWRELERKRSRRRFRRWAARNGRRSSGSRTEICFSSATRICTRPQRPPPDGWKYGDGCFVALSTNNGASWHIKPLPVQLPNHERGTNGTLGYVTARQAPNGVIHILTTETQPCLHYELNEAWIFSDAGDVAPENSGGTVKKFSENYPNGKIRSQWSARICPNGRYLLDGKETDFYETGAKQHEVDLCQRPQNRRGNFLVAGRENALDAGRTI